MGREGGVGWEDEVFRDELGVSVEARDVFGTELRVAILPFHIHPIIVLSEHLGQKAVAGRCPSTGFVPERPSKGDFGRNSPVFRELV